MFANLVLDESIILQRLKMIIEVIGLHGRKKNLSGTIATNLAKKYALVIKNREN